MRVSFCRPADDEDLSVVWTLSFFSFTQKREGEMSNCTAVNLLSLRDPHSSLLPTPTLLRQSTHASAWVRARTHTHRTGEGGGRRRVWNSLDVYMPFTGVIISFVMAMNERWTMQANARTGAMQHVWRAGRGYDTRRVAGCKTLLAKPTAQRSPPACKRPQECSVS